MNWSSSNLSQSSVRRRNAGDTIIWGCSTMVTRGRSTIWVVSTPQEWPRSKLSAADLRLCVSRYITVRSSLVAQADTKLLGAARKRINRQLGGTTRYSPVVGQRLGAA